METYELATAIGSLQLRPAHGNDVNIVHEIMCEAAEWLKSIGSEQWQGVPSQSFRDFLPKRLATRDVYLAYRDDEPVATLCLQWDDAFVWGERGNDGSAGYVHGLAIRRSVAGHGVGAQLLDWAADRCVEAGRGLLRIDTTPASKRLVEYYHSLGFRDMGIANCGFVTLCLERNLKD